MCQVHYNPLQLKQPVEKLPNSYQKEKSNFYLSKAHIHNFVIILWLTFSFDLLFQKQAVFVLPMLPFTCRK